MTSTNVSGSIGADAFAADESVGRDYSGRAGIPMDGDEIADPRPRWNHAREKTPGGFDTIEFAISEIAAGRAIVVVDDEDRENEGDLMVAADKITPEAINFMATHGRGLICLAMTGQRLDDLNIPLMVSDSANSSPHGTAFCVSIEARRGVSTGISVHDRAQTILTAIDAKTRPSDLSRPGHIFPLRARDGGVLVR
ncbi:MAG TPA: 3,4-dihydroxy-2-butanone-4-phosphate synthase, partial [Mycobacterium sp.]